MYNGFWFRFRERDLAEDKRRRKYFWWRIQEKYVEEDQILGQFFCEDYFLNFGLIEDIYIYINIVKKR